MKLTRYHALLALLLSGFLCAIVRSASQSATPSNQPGPDAYRSEVAALRAELDALKAKAPDQSHAMKDVAYHFSNLWFAGQKQNWPLAKFYLDETRSHLRWAVRIIPVRKTKAGDLDLKGILDGVDSSFLTAVDRAVSAADLNGFTTAYRQTLEGCYSCHTAAEKPYLRLHIPEQPEARMIEFAPTSTPSQ
jgi:hypothetical protein